MSGRGEGTWGRPLSGVAVLFITTSTTSTTYYILSGPYQVNLKPGQDRTRSPGVT